MSIVETDQSWKTSVFDAIIDGQSDSKRNNRDVLRLDALVVISWICIVTFLRGWQLWIWVYRAIWAFFWDRSINDFLLRVNYRRFVRIVGPTMSFRAGMKRRLLLRKWPRRHNDDKIRIHHIGIVPIMERNICIKQLAYVTHLRCVDPVRFSHGAVMKKITWLKLTADISSIIRPLA